jgi:hypothetical protein
MDPFADRQKSKVKLNPEMEKLRKQFMKKIKEPFENKTITMPYDALSKHVETPLSLPTPDTLSKCIHQSDCCNLCSGTGENPCKVVTAIPGPQWMPQTARAKQQEIASGNFTPSICPLTY